MKRLQQTANDIILTVDDKVYTADMDTFEREAGGTFPLLPKDAEYRIYEPNGRHSIVGGHGKFSENGELPWSIGDNVLNNIDEFMNAQAQAEMLAKLHDQAGYDDSVLELQKQAKAIAEQKTKETAEALANYYTTKDGLKDYSANKRWFKQRGGMISGVFGKVTTDDTSVMMLSNIVQSFSLGLLEGNVNFKGVDEWVEIDKNQATALAKEIVGFVQHCFNTELAIAADIEDGKITSTEQIDQAYA